MKALDFAKTERRPVPLTLAQAYSRLYCTQGSALHAETTQEYKLYLSGDKTILEKYKHLFPAKHNPKMKYVTFQQAIFRETVLTIPEEQITALNEFIDARHQEETDLHNHPWRALKVNDELDADLKKQYVKR